MKIRAYRCTDMMLLFYIMVFPIPIFFYMPYFALGMNFLVILVLVTEILCYRKLKNASLIRIMTINIALVFLLFVGFIDGYHKSGVSEYISIFFMISLPIAFFLLDENHAIDISRYKKAVIIMGGVYVALELLLMLTFFNVSISGVITEHLQEAYILTKKETSLDAGFGGLLPRFNYSSDILVPSLYFLYAWKRKSGIILWCIILIMELLTLSRFHMTEFAIISIVLLGRFFFEKKSFKLKDILYMIFALSIALYVFISVDWNFVYNIFELRFTGGDAVGSDNERWIQAWALLNVFIENPMLGIGLGGYVADHIRHELLWLYELGYLMFLMQMGLVGFVLFFVNFLHYMYQQTKKRISSDMVCPTILVYWFWLAEAGLQGGMITGHNVGMLFLCATILSYKNDDMDGI